MYALAPSVIRLRRMPERKRRSPDELYRARAGRRHLGRVLSFYAYGRVRIRAVCARRAARCDRCAGALASLVFDHRAHATGPACQDALRRRHDQLCYAMLRLSAGFESILNATAPLWGALIAYVWLRVPLTWLQAAGLLIGLAGVAALVWDGKGGAHGLSAWAAIIATLGATLCYGFAANYAKQRLAHVLPGVVAFGGHLSASAVLLPLALLFWPARPVSAAAWYAVGAL